MIKSRKIRKVEHVACMRKMRNIYKIFVGNQEKTIWKSQMYMRRNTNNKSHGNMAGGVD
jgi:hypothetical protein